MSQLEIPTIMVPQRFTVNEKRLVLAMYTTRRTVLTDYLNLKQVLALNARKRHYR